jgi:hypothetical protein
MCLNSLLSQFCDGGFHIFCAACTHKYLLGVGVGMRCQQRVKSQGEPQFQKSKSYLSAQTHKLVHNSSANATCAACDQALPVRSKVEPACHGPCETPLRATVRDDAPTMPLDQYLELCRHHGADYPDGDDLTQLDRSHTRDQTWVTQSDRISCRQAPYRRSIPLPCHYTPRYMLSNLVGCSQDLV